MSSGFGEITTQASDLVAAGDLAGAQVLLSDALAEADPRPGAASPELAEAAGLQARILVTLGEPHSARGWAAFAYSAAGRLHGTSDPRTVAAAATLAAVLHRVGNHDRAARLYQEVIIELTATDGPESLRVLAAHADLATVEYAMGECEMARIRLQDAWEMHREVYGDGHLSGIKMLARLGSMERDCGQFGAAHEHLGLARELCRVHLSTDHPLAIQVAALARAAADPDHVCADPAPGTPDEAPLTSAPPSTYFTPEPASTGYSAPEPVAGGYPGPESAADTTTFPPTSEPASTRYAPEDGSFPTSGYPSATSSPSVPTQRISFDPVPPVGDTFPQPEDDTFARPNDTFPHSGDAFGRPARETADGDQWWPPDIADPDEDEAPAAATPPGGGRNDSLPWQPAVTVPAAPGGGNALELSGYRTGTAGEPDGVRSVRYLPERRQSPALPALYRPPRTVRMAPIIVAGAVVVALGAAAVIVGFARAGEQPPTPNPSASTRPTATATPGATGSAPAAAAVPARPPANVRLRDSRDSVTLSWAYPLGAEGPVVVSGARTGQEPRAFQELPAGSTAYTVYGLNRSLNYCFTVAVAYSVDVVARTEAICTDRAANSPAT